MKLYSYFRSSAAYRVRIALNLKGLDYEVIPVNLLKSEQQSGNYKALNPAGLVPSLMLEDQEILTQSLAIIEWLEAEYPTPALLPGNHQNQAKIRGFSYTISCDTHPLNNLRVLKYLQNELNISDEQKSEWYRHWILLGFESIEKQLSSSTFCCGDQPTMADICLIPQVYNAQRFKVPMDTFPKIRAIHQHCSQLEAFHKAAPEQQVDAS